MRFVIEIVLLAVLLWSFNAVRANRILSEFEEKETRKASRKANIASQNWSKADPHDTRTVRILRCIHDAPSYTSYNIDRSTTDRKG